MVEQRRGEFGGHGRGRSSRARLAALLLAAAPLAAGCDAGIRVAGFGTTGGTNGSNGGTGAGNTAAALIGTWRSVNSLVLSTGETMVFDVRWQFDGGGGCSRQRIQTIVGGDAGTETRDTLLCSYSLNGSTVTVNFQGSSVPSRFTVAFAGGDLLLSGVRFTRIG